jgi:hypothetical protein
MRKEHPGCFFACLLYLYGYNIAMTNKIDQLSADRDALLAELKAIDRLRRGSLSRQVYSKKLAGLTLTQGPYYVLQGFYKGKKFSQRIPAEQADQVQRQVANFKRFQDLADQCVSLTDQITQLAETGPDGKKNSRRLRSKPSVSRKLKPS